MIRKILSCRSWALTLGILAFLWFALVNHLRVEWSVNPQYSYGWVVPLLCLGMLFQRWQAAKVHRPLTTGSQDNRPAASSLPASDFSFQLSAPENLPPLPSQRSVIALL